MTNKQNIFSYTHVQRLVLELCKLYNDCSYEIIFSLALINKAWMITAKTYSNKRTLLPWFIINITYNLYRYISATFIWQYGSGRGVVLEYYSARLGFYFHREQIKIIFVFIRSSCSSCKAMTKQRLLAFLWLILSFCIFSLVWSHIPMRESIRHEHTGTCREVKSVIGVMAKRKGRMYITETYKTIDSTHYIQSIA